MSIEFMQRWYPELAEQYQNSGGDWKKVAWSSIPTPRDKLPCMPLSTIFDELGVHHVDLFILDIEGGELAALETLDWEKLRINVLVVEVARRAPGYVDLVTRAVQRGSHGAYDVMVPKRGRNIWFARSDFVRYSRPEGDYDLPAPSSFARSS